MSLAFETSLLFGQQAEGRVRDLLCEAGAFVSKFGCTNKNDFQVVFNNQTHRVEIKNEDRKAGTGNICIEVAQGVPRKKSGIAISEASIIIHTLQDKCVLYRRAKMKEWIDSRETTLNFRPFGDNHNRGYVLAIEKFLEYPEWFDARPTSTIADSHLWMT